MLSVEARNSLTSSGLGALRPWDNKKFTYAFAQLNLGSNPISNLEIVSSLNSFNLAYGMYYYGADTYVQKYNPKVYLSAVQSVTKQWNYDPENAEKMGQSGSDKSGSCL
ncbi:MAG TPA: hypothetical protein DCY93_02045 [Firmicutes bacterium]|nr:hypothetical protein [Bacillota bacterium]